MIRIRSKKEGFRRCGITHGTTWTEYSDDFFTGDQRRILENEPLLDVETVSREAVLETEDGQPESPARVCGNTGESEPEPEPLTSARRASRGRMKRKD
ncbi:MAG: HI1506-related protein [Syntrophobacter sp.]